MRKIFAFLVIFCTVGFGCFAKERILDYRVSIEVNKDSTIDVTEAITINVENKNVKRGIVRSLPMTDGVGYKALLVNRNGVKEDFFVKRNGEFYEINTGNDNYLPRTNQTFEIKYKVFNAIIQSDNFDELYWNVTGNDWIFDIDNIEVEVKLPDNARILQETSYIGIAGSTINGEFDGKKFYSPRKLIAGEGMSIKIDFEKGHVDYSSNFTKNAYKNVIILAVLLFLVLLLYCFICWCYFGRSLKKPTVFPRFDKIKGLTAAQAGEIYYFGKRTNRLVVASLFDMAISGFINITEKTGLIPFFNDSFYLEKVAGVKEKNEEERNFKDTLKNGVKLNGSFDGKIREFNDKIDDYLKKEDNRYFIKNTKFSVFAIILSVIFSVILFLYYFMDNSMPIAMVETYLFAIMLIVYAAFIGNATILKDFKFIIYIIIYTGIIAVSGSNSEITLITATFLFFSCILNSIFRKMIMKHTEDGLQVVEHLEGLKMFMKKTDVFDMGGYSFKDMEALLPYAIILGVEKIWGKKMQKLSLNILTSENKTKSFYRKDHSINFSRFFKLFNESLYRKSLAILRFFLPI